MMLEATVHDEMNDATEFEYVGFWLRLWAGILDSILLILILVPIIGIFFGWHSFFIVLHTASTADFIVSWILPLALILLVWTARDRTLGKMAISAVVLDERTSSPPSVGQHVGRYLGFFLAAIPLGLGLLWVAFDPKKQGWHDKLAGTIVVRPRKTK